MAMTVGAAIMKYQSAALARICTLGGGAIVIPAEYLRQTERCCMEARHSAYESDTLK